MMRTIPFEDWKEMSVQDRNERLAELNSKPSMFQMLIMVILKKMEDKKPSKNYLDTKIFSNKKTFKWRQ